MGTGFSGFLSLALQLQPESRYVRLTSNSLRLPVNVNTPHLMELGGACWAAVLMKAAPPPKHARVRDCRNGRNHGTATLPVEHLLSFLRRLLRLTIHSSDNNCCTGLRLSKFPFQSDEE